MSPTIRHKYKYFHSTVQKAKDRREKFHFCRLPFDVRPRNVQLNLSTIGKFTSYLIGPLSFVRGLTRGLVTHLMSDNYMRER